MPKDSLLGAITGTCTSFCLMITQQIQVDEIFQVFIYGIIGGASGILGKLILKSVIDFFKKVKIRKVISNEK